MSRTRVVVTTVTAVVLTVASAISGCGHHEESREATSGTVTPSDRQPVASVEAPDPRLVDAPGVAKARASVVKIAGESPNCVLGGSGFVVAPDRVMTTADMLEGGETFTVEIDGRTLEAHVVAFDPRRDLAILDVPNLPATALSFATEEAVGGSDAILLGYPEDRGFEAIPARIREVIQLNGPDIDHTTTVSREVYTIRGGPPHGLSGGPLINPDGEVVGVTFGAAVDDSETGFALTAKEVGPQLADLTNTTPVATGRENC